MVVSKETVVPCQWGSEAQNFAIEQVDKGRFAAVKRLQS